MRQAAPLGPTAAVLAALLVASCATEPQVRCPPGQEAVRTAQLFLGRQAPGVAPRPADISHFVEQEVTPRFPDGVTVLDGGGQWQGAENRLMREAAKVVLIVLPRSGDANRRVAEVRAAYRARFRQDSILVVAPSGCVAP